MGEIRERRRHEEERGEGVRAQRRSWKALREAHPQAVPLRLKCGFPRQLRGGPVTNLGSIRPGEPFLLQRHMD